MKRSSAVAAVLALIFADCAVIAWYLNQGGTYAGQLTVPIFATALLALVPLASLIGQITEALRDYLGNVLAGLLNASFSNVPELAIGIALLVHARVNAAQASTVSNDFTVVRGLLIGSVINNVLLTLGLSIFAGALWHGRMKFSQQRATGYASMLALAVVGLALPTLASSFAATRSAFAIDWASVLVGGVLLLTYVVFVGSSVFGLGERPLAGAAIAESDGEAATGAAVITSPDSAREAAAEAAQAASEAREREARRARRATHPVRFALLMAGLVAVTVITVAMAGILVTVTDRVIVNTPLTPLSTGLVLFPIVCNLGEIGGALVAALRGHIDTTMEVASGSSIQVPLFVTPVLVFISLFIASGNNTLVLTLIFKPLELIVVGLVTFVYALVNLDGETSWLEGLQLLAFYAMIAITAFALPGA